MTRTTMKQLDNAVQMLNIETNIPVTSYNRITGKLVLNPGWYGIDQAYGGYRLVRMCEGGEERNIQPQRGTKTECYNAIQVALNVLRG